MPLFLLISLKCLLSYNHIIFNYLPAIINYLPFLTYSLKAFNILKPYSTPYTLSNIDFPSCKPVLSYKHILSYSIMHYSKRKFQKACHKTTSLEFIFFLMSAPSIYKLTHSILTASCLVVKLVQQQVIYHIYSDQKRLINTHCNPLEYYIIHSTKVSVLNSL